MSRTVHHAIVVTGGDRPLQSAHILAVSIFGHLVSGIVDSRINGVRSFLIAPDGSGNGWATSHEGDQKRAAWAAMCPRAVVWVEVEYGETATRVIR